MILVYEDLNVAISLWKGFFWGYGKDSPYRKTRREAGKVLLESMAQNVAKYNVNFVLGNFKELAEFTSKCGDIRLLLANRFVMPG